MANEYSFIHYSLHTLTQFTIIQSLLTSND